jgi:hypothetical protein
MKIKFKQIDDENINIIGITDKGEEKDIGQIFTPSGSGKINLNAIQICGFDEAFDLWGCGVYGDKETKNMKKDIQLCWLYPYDLMEEKDVREIIIGEKKHFSTKHGKRKIWTEQIRKSRFSFDLKDGVCGKCFNHPCTCEVHIEYENPYTVKREQDLHLNKKEKTEDKLG